MSDTDVRTERPAETSTIRLEDTRAETALILRHLQGINSAIDELTEVLLVRTWSGDELLDYLQLCRDERDALRTYRLSRHWYDIERLRLRRSRSAASERPGAAVHGRPGSGTVV